MTYPYYPIDLAPAAQATLGEIEEGCAYAEAWPIETPEAYAHADKLLNVIAAKEREIDDHRKALVAPINEAHRRAQAIFRPPLERLGRAKQVVKERMLAYRARVEQQNRLAAAAAAAAAQQGNFAVVSQAAAAMAPRPSAEGTTVRKVWTFRVDDMSKLPIEFHLPDVRAIDQVMRQAVSAKQVPELPGVVFFQEEQLAVRGR